MQPFFTDYLERLTTLHRDIEQTVAGLSPAALDWTPAPQTNSLCVLVVHLAGAERYWIGEVAAQITSGRDRAAEFAQSGLDEAALRQRLADADAFARQALETLSLADLEAGRVSPRDGRALTAGWALMHALSHTALHVGHAQITRQLWDAKAG